MTIVYFLIYLVLINTFVRISVVEKLATVTNYLHTTCLNQAPQNTNSTEILQALVCGKNLTEINLNHLLIAAGLIHIFVVSGSHLRLIETILSKISFLIFENNHQFARILNIFCLFLYSACCGLNPPIVRAFISIVLSYLFLEFNVRISTLNLILISGLLGLILNPSWCSSLSYQMSWIATLILTITIKKSENKSISQFVFYMAFIVTFNALGFPPLSATIISLMLTPILEYLFFPFAILTFFIHSFLPLFHETTHLLLSILNSLELHSILQSSPTASILFLNWVLIFGLHFIFYQVSIWQKRGTL